MSLFQLCFKSLKYRFSIHLLLFLIVALATLIITGALLVGDSVRESLRRLTDQRLGPVDAAVQLREMRSMDILNRIKKNDPFSDQIPALILNASLEIASGEEEGVILLGLPDRFWNDRKTGSGVYINRFLADKLGKTVPQKGRLRFSSDPLISPENLYGSTENSIQRMDIEIDGIIEQDQWPGAFDLYPNQKAPLLVFMPLEKIQKRIDRNDPKINTILYKGNKAEEITPPDLRDLSLRDLGMESAWDSNWLFLKSSAFFFDSTQSEAIEKALSQKQIPGFPVFAYLVNTIQKEEKSVPYSLIAGLDLNDPTAVHFFSLSPKEFPSSFEGNEILVNQWLADKLDLKKGDTLKLTFYLPESLSETPKEGSEIFRVAGILPMKKNILSKDLVPDLKGLTDSSSLTNWDPPFPIDMKKIKKEDEEYWDQYKTAPKAFIPLSTARGLWKSRFGKTSSFVVDLPQKDRIPFEKDLSAQLDPQIFGFSFLPLRSIGIQASSGSTPFDVLFLSFSSFLIISVLVLFILLIRLTYAMKYRESGILLAMGFSSGSVFRLIIMETGIPILSGILFGVFGSIVYTKFLLYGLNHWWIDSIGTPFVQYASSVRSFLIGGSLCLFILIPLAVRDLRFLKFSAPLELLSGKFGIRRRIKKSGYKSAGRYGLLLFFALAIGSLLYAGQIVRDPQIRAILFFTSAGLLLASLLFLFSIFLDHST
ncbi:MAG: ABC transporter permease, partial [Planctomycetia bacterium]|nr:ABC transporter permease [Planctomycetia bacterium]